MIHAETYRRQHAECRETNILNNKLLLRRQVSIHERSQRRKRYGGCGIQRLSVRLTLKTSIIELSLN